MSLRRSERKRPPTGSWRSRAAAPFLKIMAFLWRRLLVRTTFIAVTGSLGKTTTKDCLAALLSSLGRTAKSYRNLNARAGVSITILRTMPWHRFSVVELGTGGPGSLGPAARLLRPHIVVITGVARTHTENFANLEETAREKASVLTGLVPGGIAVVNGNDARLMDAIELDPDQVKRFGTSSSCPVWADKISARWPDRLCFQLHTAAGSHAVRTPYVGAHWTPSVLAALATAEVCGVQPGEALETVANIEVFDARMQPVRLPNGAVFLRDDYTGSIDSLEPALKVLREADAQRRILVITDYSDSPIRPRRRVAGLGRLAAECCEAAVFVGERAHFGTRDAIASGMPPENAHAFPDLASAAEFLMKELCAGDLVLLRGRVTDHVTRIFFAQLGEVKCWKTTCPKTMLCDICPELGTPKEVRRQAVPVPPHEAGTEPYEPQSSAPARREPDAGS